MKRRVLVVEDEPIIRMVLEEVLEESGWEVVVAKDGPEARARYTPDVELVLLDIRLPGADGVDLAEEFLTLRPACRVVVMSGHGTPETVSRALKVGVCGFLHKPFSFEDVAGLLDELERGPVTSSARLAASPF